MTVYVIAVFLLVALMVGGSAVLGQRHRERTTDEPYESGMLALGAGRIRVEVKYYLVAVAFVIFDLEAVILYAWSVVVPEAGWAGYVTILIFVAVLLAALFYLWRERLLDWGAKSNPRQRN